MKRTTEQQRIIDGIAQGLQEAVAYVKGDTRGARVTVIEVETALQTRLKMKLNQAEFADLLGVSQRTLENWEQGRSRPNGAARSLLRVAAKNPKMVLESLR
jgi:putative transcriptional regulator